MSLEEIGDRDKYKQGASGADDVVVFEFSVVEEFLVDESTVARLLVAELELIVDGAIKDRHVASRHLVVIGNGNVATGITADEIAALIDVVSAAVRVAVVGNEETDELAG